jgi:pimeloyl-ACP methyl ester carboxylesterase
MTMAQIYPIFGPPENFIQANGLNIYHEIHGVGNPLILLHGGTFTGRMWDDHISAFAQHFQVITMDSRGHGKTDNPVQEISYRTMADDVAAFVQALGLSKPLICGFSDGGQIALEIGMRYPDLTAGLVINAAFYKFSESYLNWIKEFGIDGPGLVNVKHIEREHPDYVSDLREWHVSQDPDYWQVLLSQLSTTFLTPLDYTAKDFNRIIVPTLILVGDRDPLVPVEQAVEMYRRITLAELAIGPDVDHGFPWNVELYIQLVLDFLLRHQNSTDQS